MTEGANYGFFAIILVATIAFCLLGYPPITEKLKNAIARKEQKNYEKAKKYGDFQEAIRNIITANIMTALWYVEPVK